MRARGCCPERRSPLSRRKSDRPPGLAGRPGSGDATRGRSSGTGRAKEGGTAGAADGVRRRSSGLVPSAPLSRHRPKRTPVSAVPPRSTPGRPARRSSARCWRSGPGQDLRQVPGDAARGRPRWTFFEGPPTANGMPGTHHVEARVFKDVFPRFRTMQGYQVERKAGWDCHGLPVELAVEKELGFSGKGDIEAYGVAEFNARCRESVLRHVDAFEEMTERMGYWVDIADPYRTMDARVRRVGLVGAQADPRQGPARRGLPRRAVLPALRDRALRPRARPGLRDRDRPQRLRALPAHLRPVRRPGLAAGLDDHAVDAGLQHRRRRARPDVDLRRGHGRHRDPGRRRAAVRGGARRGLDGRDRHGHRPGHGALDLPAALRPGRVPAGGAQPAPRRTSWCSPTTSPPRTAPAWCTSPPRSARTTWRSAAPTGCRSWYPVRPDGHFGDDVPLVGGQFFKHADTDLVERPREARAAVPARRLRAHLPALLALPHRAACTTPSRPGTSGPRRSRTRCCARTRRPNWYPDTIKWGRYGDWLDNNIDWALSRAAATGALPCRSGAAPRTTRSASGRWPSSRS